MSLEPCPHCGVMAAWPPASVSCWIRWGVTWLLRPQLTTCSGRRWSPSDQYRAALRSLLLTGPAGQLWARAAAGAGDGESRRPSSVARARGLARLTALVRVATMVAPQPRPGPHTAQHAAHHRHLITTTAIQLETKVIQRFPKISQSRRRTLSWLKAPTSTCTFKTLLRCYDKCALTPR